MSDPGDRGEPGPPTSLGPRAARSAWVAGAPGLGDQVARWEDELGAARAGLSDAATDATRPGPVPLARVLRHATAAGVSRALRIPTRLPGELLNLTPLRQPEQWARTTGAEAFADQLALGGPATAEVARLILTARRLFPADLGDELARRSIGPAPLTHAEVELMAQRTFGEVAALHERPLASLPITQLHGGRLRDGREVLVRVRRPGVARQLREDARLSGSMMTPLQQLLPQMGGLHPLGFVQLTTRQSLETADLRFEALNLVELGLVAEEAGLEGLAVARPVAGLADERVVVVEWLSGRPLSGSLRPDPDMAMRALVGLTLEPALVHGVFWADPVADHLVVTADGGLGLVGVGAAGHLSPTLRQAGILFLTAVLSGDHEGQVEAMRLAGAVPEGTDLAGLLDDLRAAENLKVSAILSGGEGGLLAGLRDATRILLAHRLRPPLDVIMLLRTVFALGHLTEVVAPDRGGLVPALFPLLQRLPDLIAAAQPTETPEPAGAPQPTGDTETAGHSESSEKSET